MLLLICAQLTCAEQTKHIRLMYGLIICWSWQEGIALLIRPQLVTSTRQTQTLLLSCTPIACLNFEPYA